MQGSMPLKQTFKMKKLLAILCVSALIYACGSNEEGEANSNGSSSETTAPAAPEVPGGVSATDEKALELIASNGCMACHAIDSKVVGPSYQDVAEKYAGTPNIVDTLIHKIQKGGMGNWGNIPMTPHPDLSDADATVMVNYILALKK